jgi:TRAP-type C4-dicarboxylate transport system substrate-binding protein
MRDGTMKRLVWLAILGLLVAACGGSGEGATIETAADVDRAGGRGLSEVTVLNFAQPNHEPGPVLELWADEVAKASDGTLEIEFHNLWHGGELDYEAQTINDVVNGEIDAAWVGARAFDTVGVTSFQPLIAPLLVDSHDLQTAVFEADIPEQMLQGLDDLGLVGIGVLPGPLFKILGKTRPYVTPDDFAGGVIGIQASELHAEVFETLGATVELMPTGADISGVEGYAQQLGSIWGNDYQFVADYVTANINLWPRPLVLFANADVYEALGDTERTALTTASAAAVVASREALDFEESESGSSLCDAGMQFPLASDDQLAGLREALQPVYGQLAGNDETSGYLDDIEGIKADLNSPPHTVDCVPTADEAAPSEIDGVYTQNLTGQDLIDAIIESGCDSPNLPDPADIPPDATLAHQLTLRGGKLELLVSFNDGEFEPSFIGTYDVLRDRVEIRDPEGEFTLHWTLDGTNLVLSDIEGGGCDGEIVWTAHPWVLADSDEQAGLTGPPEGTYSMTLSPADAPDDCPFDPLDPTGQHNETLFTLRLENGRVEMWVEYGGAGGERDQGWSGSYEVLRDRIELTDHLGTMTAHWSFEDGQLVFSDMANVPSCGDIVVWATHPWVLVGSDE